MGDLRKWPPRLATPEIMERITEAEALYRASRDAETIPETARAMHAFEAKVIELSDLTGLSYKTIAHWCKGAR
jgi:hypothetical protein